MTDESISKPIHLISVVTKPLDVIHTREYMANTGRQYEVWWAVLAHKSPAAAMAREMLVDEPNRHVISVPMPSLRRTGGVSALRGLMRGQSFGATETKGEHKEEPIDYESVRGPVRLSRWSARSSMRSALRLITAGAEMGWWYACALIGKARFRKVPRGAVYLSTAHSASLYLLAAVGPEVLVVHDGGMSTVNRGYVGLVESRGVRALVVSGLDWGGASLPKGLRDRALAAVPARSEFFTSFASEDKPPIRRNKYQHLRQAYQNKPIRPRAVVLGTSLFDLSEYQGQWESYAREAEAVAIANGLEQIVYRPHPRETSFARRVAASFTMDVEIDEPRSSIEIDLLEAAALPSLIVGYGSTALRTLAAALPPGISFVDLEGTSE
jgi:hypothetical protein